MNQLVLFPYYKPVRNTVYEAPDVWEAVIKLRKSGAKVYREGTTLHRVNKHQVTTPMLKKLAAAARLPWPKEFQE